ncbi:MAG: pre-peptidase C-terminal domain-containing protein [Verrucomicrobiales bacterium]
MRLFLLFLSFISLAAHASFSPDLSVIQPRGAERGTEATFRLVGKRLDHPQDLLFHREGIELLSFELRGKNKLYAKVRIAPDAPLGEHPLRLRTAGGISYLRSLWVGPFPCLDEAEPNNSANTAQPIALNHTVHGTSNTEDIDYFSVDLKKGQRLSVEAEAMRLGRQFFDVHLAILDSDGLEIAACDDATLLGTDAFLSIIAPKDGNYHILVREAAYEGRDSSQYRLHIGNFPRPSALFPPSAKPGETLTIRYLGDPSGPLTQQITLPQNASQPFPTFAHDRGQSSPSPNWLHISPLESVNEQEPNNTYQTANSMPPLPSAANGILSVDNDSDLFRFTAKKGQNLILKIIARQIRSPLDSTLHLREAGGKSLEFNDDLEGLDSVIKWKCPQDGDYLVNVRDKLGHGSPSHVYRLEIETRQPSLLATLPVAERNNSQALKTICIPRGNRYATAVNLSRSNLACSVQLKASALPPGVAMDAPKVEKSLNSFPVLFRATPAAPISGNYYRLRIQETPTPDHRAHPINGPLRETIHQIEINNQGPYHTVESEKIAIAVIQEAPFSLSLTPPTTPIVPKGTIQLEVQVHRAEGFEAPITLRLPWKPPGIGAPDTVKIPAGESQGFYELNASEEAQPGTWPILVTAESDTKQGPVHVSSEFVNLHLAEPFVSAQMAQTATEQGKDIHVLSHLTYHHSFTGFAEATLRGLPHGTRTTPVRFRHGTEKLGFKIEVNPDATVGKHSGLFLQIQIPHANGHANGSILHQTGQGGVLRIDPPRRIGSGKREEKKATPTTSSTQPLSRLEQLRQQAISRP